MKVRDKMMEQLLENLRARNNKVFLGGTVGNSDWRDKLIPLLKKSGINYFNPVVDDWTEDDIKIEEKEKKICDIHLYTITKEMEGCYSIAELVESLLTGKKTIFFPIYDGFKDHKKKSLKAIEKLVERNNGVIVRNFDDLIKEIK